MSSILVRKLLAFVFCISFGFSSPVKAADDEYICEARQRTADSIPVLSQDCPIGNGMWGGSPDVDSGLFWIQCGLFNDELTQNEIKIIGSAISTNVWLKEEKKGYRCLIGPYEQYSVAKKDLDQLKKLNSYKQAFIRNATVLPNTTVTTAKVTPNKPAPKKATSDKSVSNRKTVSNPTTNNVLPVTSPSVASTVAIEKREVVDQKSKQVQSQAIGLSETVVARRDVKIGDKYYLIPFLMEGYDQFYMEYNIAWNRLNYDRSVEVCASQKMRLLSEEEWQLLIDSQVMKNKQWPLHLPYWGNEKKGLFTSGKITQLSGTSLLNVVCIK